MKKTKLRCYVCGKDVDPTKRFAIASPNLEPVDRVFILHNDGCSKQIDQDQPILIVKGVKRMKCVQGGA